MATRKDLLKAYGFTSQRLIKALVDRNPDDPNNPLRRVVLGSFASVMVGVLMFAAFGIVGWLNPAKKSNWQKDKTVVVDKTSGGVFVFLEDTLYPTYNITSAKLATAGGPTVAVSTASLRTAAKTSPTTIGIPAAPSQLPDAKSMQGTPIRLCSSAPSEGQRSTTVQLAGPAPAATNPTVLVEDDQKVRYLVIDGVAHQAPLIRGQSLPTVLGFRDAVTPGTAFVNGLAKGIPLVPPPVDGTGGASRVSLGGTNVIGTVLRLPGDQVQWYVLLADGHAPIAPIEAKALELNGSKVVDVSLGEVSRTGTQSAREVSSPELNAPLTASSAQRDSGICSTWVDGERPVITVDPTDAPRAASQSSNPNLADQVINPTLSGALVQADTVADPAAGVSLVTTGQRYGLADADARAALGYAGVVAHRVPAGLIELIPQGLPAGQILSIPRASPGG